MAASAAKLRITVTLGPEILRRLSGVQKRLRLRSRSKIVEEALRLWLKDRAHSDIERAVEEYYLSLTDAEREEDGEWTNLAGSAVSKVWR